MIRKSIFVFCSLLLLSCVSQTQKEWNALKSTESTFFKASKEQAVDISQAESLLEQYANFLEQHPDFEENAEIMLRQADVYLGINKWFMAIRVYDDFEKKYPEHKKIGYVRFSKGFVCEKAFETSNYDKHKEYSIAFYKTFLEKHPNHQLAESAKGSIQSLN